MRREDAEGTEVHRMLGGLHVPERQVEWCEQVRGQWLALASTAGEQAVNRRSGITVKYDQVTHSKHQIKSHSHEGAGTHVMYEVISQQTERYPPPDEPIRLTPLGHMGAAGHRQARTAVDPTDLPALPQRDHATLQRDHAALRDGVALVVPGRVDADRRSGRYIHGLVEDRAAYHRIPPEGQGRGQGQGGRRRRRRQCSGP